MLSSTANLNLRLRGRWPARGALSMAVAVAVSLIAVALLAPPALAQVGAAARVEALGGGVGANGGRPEILRDVGIKQRMGDQVPLDAVFRDENNREVKLAEYFGGSANPSGKPVVLVMAYYQCPRLCGQVLRGLLTSLENLSGFSVGPDFKILTVSFDPTEGPELAAQKKASYARAYNRPGAEEGWHFLTGSEESIRKLADAVGFHYKYDEANKQYAHASGIMVLTPDGKVSRYLLGIDYSPRDLRLALVEASANKIGTPVIDMVLQYCFHYDPVRGKYNVAVMNLVRASGVLTVFGIAVMFILLRRRPRTSGQSPVVTLG
jgi:protein SCO1/2